MVEKIMGNALTDDEMKKINKIAEDVKERTGNDKMKVEISIDPVEESVDETKGFVGEDIKEGVSSEGYVVEKSHEGKGFQIWRDVQKNNEVNLYDEGGRLTGTRELKRLTR